MATQNEILELLLRAKKVGSGDKEMASGLKAVKTTYTELRSAISLASQAIQSGMRLYDQVVGKTLRYSQTVRELSGALRLSTEETSRLIQVGDDYLISAEEIRGALEMAVKRGFVPSIENIAALADEVNAIASPTERAARLAEIFGRNWAVLDPILQAGGEAIRANAAAISENLVLSESAVAAAREHELAIDALKDSYEGATIALGQKFIPILTKLAQGLEMTLTAQQKVRLALVEHEEEVRANAATYEAYVAEVERANEVATRFGVSVDAVSEAYFRSQRASKDFREEHDLALAAIGRTKGAVDDAAEAIPRLSSAEAEAKAFEALLAGDEAGAKHFLELAAAAGSAEDATRLLIEQMKRSLAFAERMKALGLEGFTAGEQAASGNVSGGGTQEGFQHGGSVVVPGFGSPDSRIFVSRVSPGERIDFTPEGERGGGRGTTVNIFNQMDALAYRQRFRENLRGR